jgi:hypothetical protein
VSACTLCPFSKYSPVFQKVIHIISEDLDGYSSVSEGLDDYHTVTCKTVTMFGTFSVYNLWRLYVWESHFMLVRDIGEPTPGYTWTPGSRDLAQGK